MKVTISVPGKFQTAYLFARYLEAEGRLERLITTLPFARGASFGVSRQRTHGIGAFAYWYHGFERWGIPRLRPLNQLAFCIAVDSAAARLLGEAEIFNGWATISLASMREAQRRGMRTVLQTGSTHIGSQTDTLREEFARWSPDAPLTHPELVKRSLREYELADFVLVPSLFARRTFIERGHEPERVVCVPWAVFPVVGVPRERLVRARPRILHVGNTSVRKGIPYLLEAFRGLEHRAELRLVGPPNPRLLKRLGGLPPNTKVLGRRRGQGLAEEYQDADIFVLASVEEGSALVVWEAMAAGLPIVTTDRAGADQIIDGENGFVVPAGDTGALLNRLEQLINDPELRARLGASAAASFAARDWATYGRDVCAVIDEWPTHS